MMTRLLPCFTVAVATATATTTRVTMDDEPAFFAAALARDDAAARWRAEASAANVRALGVAPGRVVLLFAAPALSEEARALAALGYRVEAYDLVGDEAADVELRLFDRFLGDLGRGEGVVFFRPGAAFTRLPGPVGALVAPPTPSAAALLDAAGGDAWAAACGAFAAWSAVAKAWPSTQVCRDTVRAREARGAGRWGLPFVVRGARLPRGLFADAAAAQASLRRALAPFGLERVSAAAPLWLAWASDVTVAVDARLDVHDGAGSYDEAAAAGVVAAPAALGEDPLARLCADDAALDVEGGSAARLYVELALDAAVARRGPRCGPPRAARDVLFVSVQPDIAFLRWQGLVFVRNFIDRGVRPRQVALVWALGPGAAESKAVGALRRAGCRVRRYADDRPATAARDYTGSIRLYVMAKFVRDFRDELARKRVFYHDADIVFPRALPRVLREAAFPDRRARTATQLADATSYTGWHHVDRTARVYAEMDASVDVWRTLCAPLHWDRDACSTAVRAESEREGTGIFSQGLLTGLWEPEFWAEAWAAGDAMFRAMRPLEIEFGLAEWSWQKRTADVQLSFKSDMFAPLWLLWRDRAAGRRNVTSAVEDGFAFSWAVSPARALSEKPILHMAGAAGRCGDRTLGAAAATCGFFKNEWVLRSPVHALCRDPAEFDYVTDTSASLFFVEVMRDLIAKGLPGGFDACDAALYADEPKLMHKYTRGDGGVVYEYYARENAQSETVCGARCFVRERFTHVNITDVALEGTTESTRREAPGVAEREGPCAALCPGG